MLIFKEIIIFSTLIIIPYISSDCLEFWKNWRTCPPDLFADLSDLLCFHQINNTDQAVITKTSPKQAGIVCHTDSFPFTLFNCLPIENTTLFIFTNCPFPQIPFSQTFQDKTLQELSIKFNKIKKQERSLDIDNYPFLQIINLEGIRTGDYFNLKLDNLPSLQTFTIYDYNFTALPSKPFKNVLQLQQILISMGQFDILPEDLFHGLSNLTFIDLSSNHLNEFPSSLLVNAFNLKLLNLSHNHLTELHKEVFYKTNNLEQLHLDNNKITKLPEGVFSRLLGLKYLLLNNNNISELPEKIFRHLGKLQLLSLQDNEINFLPENVFANLASLIRLDLQNNNIAAILPESLFKDQTFLHHLDLSGNVISGFKSASPFGFSKYLFMVNISNNRLRDIPDINWKLYNISHIDLSHNNINNLTFPEGLVQGCVFDLRYNEINPTSSMVYLPSEHVFSYQVYMEGNPFKCNCSLFQFTKALEMFPIKDKEKLECYAPWFHKYKKVLTLTEEELCLNDIICPMDCKCVKKRNGEVHIDCSNAAKTSSPLELPKHTTLLDLDNNSIAEMPNSTSLSELRHLIISNNLLLSLSDFVVPPHLKTLALDGNRLSDLPKSLKDHVETMEDFKIYLANNAWICNCHSRPLKEWFMRNLPKVQDSMRTYCLNNLKTGKRTLLVETRIEEFACSSSVRKCKSLLLSLTVFILLLLCK